MRGLTMCAVLTGVQTCALPIFGISGGATVGAVSVIVLGISFAGVVGSAAVGGAAFIGALVALLLVLGLARGRSGALPPARTVLAGVAIGQICAAYTSFLVIVTGDRDAARRVLDWTLGSVRSEEHKSELQSLMRISYAVCCL